MTRVKYRVIRYKSEDTFNTYCIQTRKWWYPKWGAAQNNTRYRVESEANKAMICLQQRESIMRHKF